MAELPPYVQFYEAVRRAAIDALAVIRQWETDGKFFLRRTSFPVIHHHDSGLPYFTDGQGILGDTPVDYDYPFGAFSKDRIPLPASWESLWAYVCQDERLREYFAVDRFADQAESPFGSIAKFNVQYQLRQLLDHYIHVTGLRRFRKRQFFPLFASWALACYPKKARVRFAVPIIVLDFEVDTKVEVGDGVWVEKMSEDFQLARAPRHDQSVSVNPGVLGAATHALVLDNWELPNASHWDRDIIPTDLNALEPVLPHIERFFTALRVVTGYDTGYGQIVTCPKEWCDRWMAHLRALYVAQVREYSERLEQQWRYTPRPVVSADALTKVGRIYAGLRRGGSNRLAIAAKRLSAAYLRREASDAVLDICIGLEALFVGEERGETTHKLANRIAAVWCVEQGVGLTPFEAFGATKRLYDYRSAVVHGSRQADRKRMIRPRPGVELEAVNLGLDILRHCLAVTVERPGLLLEGALDRLLIDRGGGPTSGAS